MTKELQALQESADQAVRTALDSQDNIMAQLSEQREEARIVREIEIAKAERERIRNRRRAIFQFIFLCLLVVIAVYNGVNGRHIIQNNKRLIDCTTAGHTCYEDGQQKAGLLIQQLKADQKDQADRIMAGQESVSRDIQSRIDQDYLQIQSLMISLWQGRPATNVPRTLPQRKTTPTVTTLPKAPVITTPTTLMVPPVTTPPKSNCSIDVLGVLHGLGFC